MVYFRKLRRLSSRASYLSISPILFGGDVGILVIFPTTHGQFVDALGEN